MKERPIIQGYEIAGRMPVFQQWGRQAIRNDRKTQTRRVIKPQPDKYGYWKHRAGHMVHDRDLHLCCPYGQPGDIRIMTEPLVNINGFARYADDKYYVVSNITGTYIPWRWKVQVLSSLFMPYEAARTLTRYTNVRVERLREISEEDALAEGMYLFRNYVGRAAIEEFQTTWDFLNAKPKPLYVGEDIVFYISYPWEDVQEIRKHYGKHDYPWHIFGNPSVWIVEFERVKP